MRLPVLKGLIRRRLLVNFRVDAEVMRRFLPPAFRPKLHAGYAIAGICLIRLEAIRPIWLPTAFGISSENAAHRIAVLWNDKSGRECEGVFIPRRDTGSWLNHLAGGRVFPGEHQLADFHILDEGRRIEMDIQSGDRRMAVRLRARETDSFPASSCFASLEESSAFFERGSIGYSVTRDCCRLDGIRLETLRWQVKPLAIEQVESTFFAEDTVFPAGSVTFDHALIMRDIGHQWHEVEEMFANCMPDPVEESASSR